MLFNRNAIWMGLILGVAVPIVGYALLLTLFEQLDAIRVGGKEGVFTGFRPRTIALMALSCNIIPFHLYQRIRYTDSMRGIVVPTAIYAIIWIIYYGQDLFA